MNLRTKSILLLLLAGLLFSTGGVFIKTSSAGPFVIASGRAFIAAIVFLIVLKGRPKLTWSKPQVIGSLAYCGVLTGFVLANTYTTAANAILIEFSSPIYVAILAWFILRERLRIYDLFAIIGVIAGLWLLMSNNLGGGHLLGDMLALATGIANAVFAICLRMQKNDSAYETIFLGNILTFLVGLPFFFITPPNPAAIIPLLIMGVLQNAIPYLLMAYASKYAKAIDVSLLTVLEPLLNPVWVFMATGEKPGLRSLIGGAVVLTTVILKSIATLHYDKDEVSD
jgi:drug/metabolite transporter (DMT)-like permease